VKRKREKAQKQSSLLSKVTRLLSIHDSAGAGIYANPFFNENFPLRTANCMKISPNPSKKL
jgi:hypothetical protein